MKYIDFFGTVCHSFSSNRERWMKSVFYLLLTVLLLPFTSDLSAHFNNPESVWKFEAKISAYCPSSKVVRKLYNNVLPYYEFEAGRTFFCNWQGFMNVGLVYDKSDSKGCSHQNELYFVPVTAGLKYVWHVESFVDFYAGLGASWAYLNANNHIHYLHQKISRSSFGGVFRLGMVTRCVECLDLDLDLFTEYLSQPFTFEHHCRDHSYFRRNLNMSGFKLGAGLIYNY